MYLVKPMSSASLQARVEGQEAIVSLHGIEGPEIFRYEFGVEELSSILRSDEDFERHDGIKIEVADNGARRFELKPKADIVMSFRYLVDAERVAELQALLEQAI